MDWFVRAFIKASVVWLALGTLVGLAMAVHPTWTVYRTVHMHMMLLGFVTMMIYGVAYHVLPRFVGNPLHSRRAAGAHFWVANAGLTLMSAGFALRANASPFATALLGIGGALAGAGAYIFAYLVWRTVDGGVPLQIRATPHNPSGEPGRSPIVQIASRS
ncbi:MAG TPA: cbb3-type cytochrome c oxidase subunit I [Gemmatimonadaceae bacterium]|jgi:cbb3-type cytochrome oxidase subunit 1|nr:cbb3-type cytochrome c oxidase subunit I [Gemmatimonadaceae bacterium]